MTEFARDGGEHGEATVSSDTVSLNAGANTDWFFKPDGSGRASNVVQLSKNLDAPVFTFSAKVHVDFASTYDAGALFVASGSDDWAKIAFEMSASGQPTIVSVVTRTLSDDADGPAWPHDHVWLRLYCDRRIVAFHFSEDGRSWRFVRLFTLPGIGDGPLRIGLGAQSPTGSGTVATFSDVRLRFELIDDLRDGS